MTNKYRLFGKIFISVVFLFVGLFTTFANEPVNTHETHEGANSEESFNAGEMILEHIGDAHDWHVFGHVSMPLPVILYSSEKGVEMFLSSKFEHGHAVYNGYKLEHNH